MRTKTFFIGMLLLCSLVALPVFAQDDTEPVEGETPEFTLEDGQAVSVNDGDARDTDALREEMEASGVLYIIIEGRFVAAYWNGHVLRIYCRNHPDYICAIIRVRW